MRCYLVYKAERGSLCSWQGDINYESWSEALSGYWVPDIWDNCSIFEAVPVFNIPLFNPESHVCPRNMS